jgi:hypothetical protein
MLNLCNVVLDKKDKQAWKTLSLTELARFENTK